MMDTGEWYRTWAFPIDERRAAGEGYQSNRIDSGLPATADYPGCPYCGDKGFLYDPNCGKISCYHGENPFTCPWCGQTYTEFSSIDKISCQGGDI